jgi:hypothetical protein
MVWSPGRLSPPARRFLFFPSSRSDQQWWPRPASNGLENCPQKQLSRRGSCLTRRIKYGATSYISWVAYLHYKPEKPVLDGLSLRLLYIGKMSPDTAIPLKDINYYTNFRNLNFVTQATFEGLY